MREYIFFLRHITSLGSLACSLARRPAKISHSRRHNSCVLMTSLIWLTAEEAAKNRVKVISLYRQLLRSINSPKLELSYASRLAKKAEVKTIFLFGSEEISKHNVADLIRTGEYALSQLKQGKIPNNTTQY